MVTTFLILSLSCFFLMGEFFEKATSDLLKVWLNTEQVSLDQGNYISSFSKLQRSIHKDSYIKGFTVIDSEGRVVFSTGETFHVDNVSYSNHKFIVVHRGFFSNAQQAQFAKLRMTVYSSSDDLMFIYLLIVGYIVLLSSVFVFFLKRIITREEQVKTEKEMLRLTEIAKINEALSIQAKQVAHDIRSPLSVLSMIVPSLVDDSVEKKDLVKQAVDRINSIAEELLNKHIRSNLGYYSYSPRKIIERIVNEKNATLVGDISLTYDAIDPSIVIAVKMKESDLERILSNLINNAIEAVDNKTGEIKCSFQRIEEYFEFTIIDNGKGIPNHLLDKLGQNGVSFGKEGSASSGSGLGLFHAKKTLEEVGGELLIANRPTNGIIARVRLPVRL